LQLDQLLRLPAVRGFLKRKNMQSFSDTTLQRVLAVFLFSYIREFLLKIFIRSKKNLAKKVQVGNKRLSLGAIDGSSFGLFLASCFLAIGSQVNLFIDAEKMEKKGKELPTSLRLMKRLVNSLGSNFIDVLLVDGLYFAKDFINYCILSDIDVVCKTKEEDLCIIKDNIGFFDKYEDFPELAHLVEHEKGFDDRRLCEFEVWACGGFNQPGVLKPLKVARIKEYYPKKKKDQHQLFYAISTRDDLSANELRELGHIRWTIENNGFKHLNAIANTKRVFTHDPHSFIAALLIFFCAYNLINLFTATLSEKDISALFGKAKKTTSLVCLTLFFSLFSYFSYVHSPP